MLLVPLRGRECSDGRGQRRSAMCGTGPDYDWVEDDDEERPSWLGRFLNLIPGPFARILFPILALLLFLIIARAILKN